MYEIFENSKAKGSIEFYIETSDTDIDVITGRVLCTIDSLRKNECNESTVLYVNFFYNLACIKSKILVKRIIDILRSKSLPNVEIDKPVFL